MGKEYWCKLGEGDGTTIAREAELGTNRVQQQISPESNVFDVLKREMRSGERENAMSWRNMERFAYARGLMKLEVRGRPPSVNEVNAAVKQNLGELKLMAKDGRIKDKDTAEAIGALADYTEKYLKRREWKALALSLDEPNDGLRISPDLARALLVEKDPEEAVRKYKKEAEELYRIANYSFKADVISYFKDGKPKRGPEHKVLLVESEIEWSTGEVKGKYLFVMMRYEIDTEIRGYGANLINFALNPHPEYEPFGSSFRKEGNERIEPKDGTGQLQVVDDLSRVHWIPYRIPDGQVARTRDGKRKVTAMADTENVVRGHGNAFVPKDAEEAHAEALKRNPKLVEPEGMAQGAFLFIGMGQAAEDYRKGESYDALETRIVMLETAKNDPLSRALR